MSRRWRLPFRRRREDLQAEIDTHLRTAIAHRIAQGESEEAARQATLREFGNVPLIQDVTRQTWGWLWLEWLARDLGYTLRQIRRSPGFAVSVIGTLALGIAAAAAMFTVVDHVLLRPVPYRDPRRLVEIQEVNRAGKASWPQPWLDIEQWIRQSRSFRQIAFFAEGGGRHYLEGNTTALLVEDVDVSANLLHMLGVPPELGHAFLPEPPGVTPGKNAGTIVLSDAAWRDLFSGDPGIPGKVVRIDNTPYTVAGIMPPGFRYPVGTSASPQVWVPLQPGKDDQIRTNNANDYSVLARLRPGVTIAEASAEMTVIQKRVSAGYADAQARQDHSGIRIHRYEDTLVDAGVWKALLALLAASGVLWLIASLNVANLLLARSTARQREMAMRRALGASRWRVVQKMMVEGLVLSAIAGALGFALALGSVRLMAHELAQHLPLPAPATPDWQILGALLAMTVTSALMATAWPALLTARAPIEPALKQGGQQTGTARRHNRVRGALVAAQVALSLTLLVICGLLLQTIYRLRRVPLGFRTDHIIVADLNIPSFRFAGKDMMQSLYAPLLERIQHLHGVQSAGLMNEVPLQQTFGIMLALRQNNNQDIHAWLKPVSPEIQRVFGFRMLAGRFFNSADTPSSQPVVVVNTAFMRQYAPDKHNPASALGMTFWHIRQNAPMHIVGVLDDQHQWSIGLPSQPEVDVCLCQITPKSGFYRVSTVVMDAAIRTDQPAQIMVPEIRDILRHASPELATATITTMDQIVEDSYGSQRLAAHLLEIFGGTALLLCIAGLFGLLSYIVVQRTREIGLRIALGATRETLLWLVLRQAGGMLLAGVVAGGGMAFASSRLVQGFLYGVSAHDGWTLAGSATLLFTAGMLAAYLPARRAARVDPMQSLRAE